MLVFIKACEWKRASTYTTCPLRLLLASLAGSHARLHQGLRAEASQQHLHYLFAALAARFASLRLLARWLACSSSSRLARFARSPLDAPRHMSTAETNSRTWGGKPAFAIASCTRISTLEILVDSVKSKSEEEMEVETASAASLRTRNDRQLRGAERSHGLGDLVGCRGRQHINLPSARASWAAAKEPRHVIRASDIAVSRGDCFQKVLGFGLEL